MKIFCYHAIDSAKIACVRADFFSAFSKFKNLNFLNKSDFKGIFKLKTVYFAYKPISDNLF